MNERSRDHWAHRKRGGAAPSTVIFSFGGSILVHAALIGMLFIGFDHTPKVAAVPAAIHVTMISASELPKPGPRSAGPRKTAAPPAPEVPEAPEAPLVTETDLAAMQPDTPAPPPAPEPPPEKTPALKKPSDPPAPIPPASRAQVVIENAPKAEDPPVKKAPQAAATPPAKTPTPPPRPAAPKAAPKKPEPKVIQRSDTFRKSADSQKSVVPPSASRADSIKEAINKVRSRARKSAGTASGGSSITARRSGAADSAGSGGVAGGTGIAGGRRGAISDIYKAQISEQIERNWAFSTNLAGGRKDLQTILVITILPTGQIQNLWYEQRSGNQYLDQSAYNAVMKSNPLPPLPKGLSEYTIALVFTPAGLN